MKKILNYDLPDHDEINNVFVMEENDDWLYPVWISIKHHDFEECERPEQVLEVMKKVDRETWRMLLSIDELRDLANNMLAFADLMEKTI